MPRGVCSDWGFRLGCWVGEHQHRHSMNRHGQAPWACLDALTPCSRGRGRGYLRVCLALQAQVPCPSRDRFGFLVPGAERVPGRALAGPLLLLVSCFQPHMHLRVASLSFDWNSVHCGWDSLLQVDVIWAMAILPCSSLLREQARSCQLPWHRSLTSSRCLRPIRMLPKPQESVQTTTTTTTTTRQ